MDVATGASAVACSDSHATAGTATVTDVEIVAGEVDCGLTPADDLS